MKKHGAWVDGVWRARSWVPARRLLQTVRGYWPGAAPVQRHARARRSRAQGGLASHMARASLSGAVDVRATPQAATAALTGRRRPRACRAVAHALGKVRPSPRSRAPRPPRHRPRRLAGSPRRCVPRHPRSRLPRGRARAYRLRERTRVATTRHRGLPRPRGGSSGRHGAAVVTIEKRSPSGSAVTIAESSRPTTKRASCPSFARGVHGRVVGEARHNDRVVRGRRSVADQRERRRRARSSS